MADVTGTIGNEPVELNNAATEATLRSLLSIAKTDSAVIKALAAKAGVDVKAIKDIEEASAKTAENLAEVNKQTEEQIEKNIALAKNINFVETGFKSLTSSLKILTSGTATTADTLKAFSKMPGPIGLVATGFGLLADYQQKNLEGLQKMASSGATFSGSLTELRVASAKSFLSLDEFASSVKKNSDVFSSMGGSVQDGVNKFVKIQNTLLAPGSQTQMNLASLGYSAADAADLTASYMRSQGSMNKAGLQDTQKVSASVAEYAQELTSLAAITGKSREEIQKKMDEENAEAQWNAALAAMSPEKADKLRKAVEYASAQGGKGAVDSLKAMALGFPPMTEAARTYTATQQAGTAALHKYNEVANDSSISVQQAGEKNRAILAKAIHDGANDMDKMRTVLQAGGLTGNALATTLAEAQKMQTKYMKDNKMMSEAEIKSSMDAEAKKAATAQSEAAAVDEGNKRLQSFNAALLEAISPLITMLTPALKYIAPVIMAVTAALVGLKTISIAMELWERAKLAREQGGGALGMAKTLVGGGGGGKGGPGGVGALGEISKVGGGIGPVLEGLASGLKAFANPMILAGAAVFAGSLAIIITGVGAGVAAAAYLIGKSLPTFSEGLDSFSKIDGKNLQQVSLGIGALGVAMAAFGAGSAVGAAGNALGGLVGGITKLFGGNDMLGTIKKTVTELSPIIPNLNALGTGLQNLAQGMAAYGKAVSVIDIAKAERVRDIMKPPSAASNVVNAGANVLNSAAGAISSAFGGKGSEEKTQSDMQALNTTMRELLRYMKNTAENTANTIKAVEHLDNDFFHRG